MIGYVNRLVMEIIYYNSVLNNVNSILVVISHVQIYKLELEQKRLEEDAFVYNWLQQQLKLSPAYKKVAFVLIYSPCPKVLSA